MKSPRKSMKEACSEGSRRARCLKPGIDNGCASGLYGKRGLMQLEVRKVSLSLPGNVSPVGGAVVKKPLWLLEAAYW